MAASERAGAAVDLVIVPMRESDIPDGVALVEGASWNQTADDWALMLRLGEAFAIGGPDGRLIATALALPYPPDFGWVAMVLVDEAWRRRGLGTRLLERAIAALRERGLVACLDATPAGRTLYEPMGFRPLELLTRWRGAGAGRTRSTAPPVPDPGSIAELDRAAFGADRTAVLDDLLRRQAAISVHDPGGRGFLVSRPGRTATYVGPVVATETGVALDLLDAALAAISGPVMVDVFDREHELADLLANRGFERERPFTRMALEHDAPYGDPGLVRAIAGPELG